MSTDPRVVGERIEALLEASSASGPVVRERAEELLRQVVDLYGAGLERLMELAYERGALTDELLEDLAGDDLVSSLLLVHGLHPYDVEDRVERALAGVRPYLGTHGGDVHLVEVTPEGVVRLRMMGSCDGCPSSSVTLQLAVEGAITDAAPEVVSIELEETPKLAKAATLISTDSLNVRLRETARWESLTAATEVAHGRATHHHTENVDVVLCRVVEDIFAYRDHCPTCNGSLADAAIARTPDRGAVLTCPGCRAHYDVRRAGVCTDADNDAHLEPLPLLVRDGLVEVALPSPALA